MNVTCVVVTLLLVQGGLLSAHLEEKIVKQSTDILNESDETKYQDCEDVRNNGGYELSGHYRVYLNTSDVYWVNCTFELGFTGTSIMQQREGQISFVQPWNLYKSGFHSTTGGDFWIGLDGIRYLTLSGHNVLTVTMQNWSNKIKSIKYRHFSIGPEVDGYYLNISGYDSSASLPDDFAYNNGMRFATIDRPDVNNCAVHQRGGWWYNYCTYVLPTGKYYPGGHYTPPPGQYYDGIYYKDWMGYSYSLKFLKLELSRQ